MVNIKEQSDPPVTICYVTTLPVTLRAFVWPTATYLASQGVFKVLMVANSQGQLPEQCPPHVAFVPVPMNRGVSFDGIRAIARLARLFRDEQIDIVQYSTPNAALYAAIAAKLVGVPVRVYAQWGIRYVGFDGWRRRLFKALEKTICQLSTHVEPDSHGNREFAVTEGLYRESKSWVNWNGSAAGVDLSIFDVDQKQALRTEIRAEFGVASESFVLGFVGRLSRDKGGNELLYAARRLALEFTNFYVLLVGGIDGDDLDVELREWAANHPRVVLTGPSDRVPDFLAAMDVMTLPSYREGFGTVIIEAEAMSVPVIVSGIPGPLDAMIPEVTGLVVPAGNVDELYAAILTLMKDEERRQSMGRAGRRLVASRFSRSGLLPRIYNRRIWQARQAGRYEASLFAEPSEEFESTSD